MNTTPNRKAGIALLTVVIFVAVALLVLGALALRAISHSKTVDQYQAFESCFQGCETGQAQSKALIESGLPGSVGLGTWTPPVGTPGAVPSFDDPQLAPTTLATMPRLSYFTYAQNWSNDGVDNNGDALIDGPEEAWTYTIHSYAQFGAIRRRTEAVFTGGNVNVWRNAIFAGAGQAGGLVNGNVSIHGSVHLLGDALPGGGTAIEALDLSGTSLIHNNYVGIPAALSARIPALLTTSFNGENVQTLNAKLRVRNGLVGTSGNSEIGEANVAGNAFKETMDGTFVSDGWTGTSVNDDGGRGDPTRVWSDNGWDNNYDLGTRVSLPLLDDDWRDPLTGAKVMNPATGHYYTHTEYFHSQLTATPYNGNMSIQANQNFYYNATRPGDANPAHRLPTDDYLLFDAASNVLEMNGQIEVNGNLTITRGGGNDKTIHYKGRCAILVHGDATLNTDLLSMNANGTTNLSFPVNSAFGIMAQNNLDVGMLSQLQLMGAFYAQNRVRASKQTTVIGTFVGNYFDMGTNVPDIYQVPGLADNLPFGMVGAYPILVMSQVSWRELGA